MTGDVGSPFWWSEVTGDVHVAFTSVQAGNLATHVGDPQEAHLNRDRLARTIGGAPRFLHQVHSAEVIDAAVAAEEPTGDAWVSDRGTALAIMVADCLPVLFTAAGESGPITAAAHAGRPGLLAGVLENTVAAMTQRGGQAITAWIGPGACGACYEIPEQMVEAIAADRPAIRSRTSWGTAGLDLRAEARSVLEGSGVAVIDVPGCTMEDPQLFSHRRSQQSRARPGRIAGVVWC